MHHLADQCLSTVIQQRKKKGNVHKICTSEQNQDPLGQTGSELVRTLYAFTRVHELPQQTPA